MSVNKLSINTIKQMPAILGETDLIKSILTLPGVTNAGEGQSGFNVRGGAADQNLVFLMRQRFIIHLTYLVSFQYLTPMQLKILNYLKVEFPSRFGGRVASVLEIYQKDGNSSDFHMNGGIGIISSRLLAEGPIIKNRGSFLFAGRSSYAHLF